MSELKEETCENVEKTEEENAKTEDEHDEKSEVEKCDEEIAQKLAELHETDDERKKTPITNVKKPTVTFAPLPFNPSAPPFEPPPKKIEQLYPTINIGPSQLPVNGKIWEAIANNRQRPSIPHSSFAIPPFQMPVKLPHVQPIQPSPAFFTQNNIFSGYNHPPPFEDDYTRNLVFTRDFGPVAHPNGFVELRLRESITVFISLDRSVLIQNPKSKVKIAVCSNMMSSSLDHPNGKVIQVFERVDIMAFDGTKKLNKYVRYAKMWEKGISLTAEGCALIYLVDAAGTRTTSDAVNKDRLGDYCWGVFVGNCRIGPQYYHEADVASKSYHFFTQDDGTTVFDILGYRVSQTQDGMVRVTRSNNRLKIHTSPSNGSATLSTPVIHCTASMGQSSHLFVRREERRMHFDGTSFVVRNAGHSSGFDEQNNLRVY